MAKATRDATLPKPRAAKVDWRKVAESPYVWEFIEGEDFNGNARGFKARAKTAAHKQGVDFESVEVERRGKAVLKVLAHFVEQPGAAVGSESTGGAPAHNDDGAGSRTP